MADEKKAAKTGEKSGKEAVKATLQALAKPEAQKAVVAAAPSKVAPVEVQVQAPKVVAPVKTEPQAEAPQAKAAKEPAKAQPEMIVKPEAPKAEAEAKKEADPNKEFVDGIMAEMALKGASKKRLIKKLAEQYGFDKQKVLFRLKRALITERYAAASGH